MPLIDSHCHLAYFERKGQLSTILKNAEEAGVERLITIGTSREDWSINQNLATRYPHTIDYTVGLHPCDVKEDWEEQLQGLVSFFTGTSAPLALGEIGLDHFHLPKSSDEAEVMKTRQIEAFRRQLALAQEFDCPVVVHSRHAFNACLEMIDEAGIDWEKVLFHCFAEGLEEISKLNKRGGRGSFTGIITYKNAPKIRQALLHQGLERLILETDAPYLAPVPKRGKPNEPAYLHHTAEFCAELLGLKLPQLEAKTTANTEDFFGL